MKKMFLVFTALFVSEWMASAQVAPAKIWVQVIVVEPGGKTGSTQQEFSKRAKPGAGKQLKVRVSADRNCTVSAAAFTKDGQLVYGVPEIVQLLDNKAKELPQNLKWTWDGHESLEEIDLIVAGPGADDHKEYQELVKKMGQSTDDVRSLQTGAMRRWIDAHLKSSTTAADYSVKEEPTQVGGMIRGDAAAGQEVSIPAKKSAVIRLRVSQ